MGKLDIAALAEKLAQLNKNSNGGGGNKGGVSFLDVKDGRNVIRILPPAKDAESFYTEAWVHYGVGKTKDNKKGTMVVCPTTNDENAKCPVCELSKEFYALSSKKDDDMSKQAKSFFRKKRVYYNAISRDEDLSVYEKQGEGDDAKWMNTKTDEEESPVKVFGSGVGIFKDIIGLIVDPEYGDVTDEEEGLDLIITKTGSGQFNTNYDVKTVRKESPVGFDKWEESLNDLSIFTKSKTYEEIAKIMEGGEPEVSDDKIEEGTSMMPDKNEEPTTSNEEPESGDDLGDEIAAALKRRRSSN